jgi:hypothetical protein
MTRREKAKYKKRAHLRCAGTVTASYDHLEKKRNTQQVDQQKHQSTSFLSSSCQSKAWAGPIFQLRNECGKKEKSFQTAERAL